MKNKADNGVSPINSIVVRISALNIGMLVAFLVVMIFIMRAMTTSTTSSIDMFGSMMSLTSHEAALKTDVMSLYDQVTGYIASDATETKEALLPQIEIAEQKIEDDISQLNEDFAQYDNERAANQLQEISGQYERMIELIDAAIAKCDSGDQTNAYRILFDKAEIQKVAIIHSTEVLDEAISDSAEDTSKLMNELMNQGKIIAAIGAVIIIVLIVLNFLVSYFSIVVKVKDISKEVNEIIDNIEKGRGDLTARIETKTKSELSYITNGINHFIETLQGIMKDVKDGTVVLTASSEEVSSQLKIADDNVTSSSAALEQLSANMESVVGILDSINERVEDVKVAAQKITDQAESGSSTANEIKQEADDLQVKVNTKKADVGEKMAALSDTLEKSVKDSEKVSQISDLTNDILDIANEVTSAVNTLADNAKDVLEFINGTVIGDYDEFVDTGEKYGRTADVMNEMLTEFTEKADGLNEIMKAMVESVETITNSVQESSLAINMSAENSNEIVTGIKKIFEAMDKNTEVAEQLNDTTQKFTSL